MTTKSTCVGMVGLSTWDALVTSAQATAVRAEFAGKWSSYICVCASVCVCMCVIGHAHCIRVDEQQIYPTVAISGVAYQSWIWVQCVRQKRWAGMVSSIARSAVKARLLVVSEGLG